MFVAWQRHAESIRSDALFRDPLADWLTGTLADHPDMRHCTQMVWQVLGETPSFPAYFTIRTRYFDDRIEAALRDGVRQIVTLAGGLDGRPFRLTCPPDAEWFEIDLPDMCRFKQSVAHLADLRPRCHWHPVAADLTGEWLTALTDAGFDPTRPSVWLIEGLLMYLSDADGDALLATARRAAAPGSQLLLEHLQTTMLGEAGRSSRNRVESQGARWLSARDDVPHWLAGHGWVGLVHAVDDPAIGLGREVGPQPAGWLAAAIPDRAVSAVPPARSVSLSPTPSPEHLEVRAVRLPNSTYFTRGWRLPEVAPDFRVEDVWVLPARGARHEFAELVRQIADGDGAFEGERVAMFLHVVRQRLGAWFGLDRPGAGLDARVVSLRARLPEDAAFRDRGPDQRAAPWVSVYQNDREWVGEYASRTVHALMHVGWVSDATTDYRGEMTILVRPNGLLGTLYMAFIRPFRRFVINPAFFRMVARNWQRHRTIIE
ncbi:SAM-dependent methyltransferase [Nocardia sp. NBC_01499]|uniref:SAM-dependent methyltransferase n=1 Tax=Nocardia sp. NBC_01499 TaxID=2903597 RepID=UPI0038674E74